MEKTDNQKKHFQIIEALLFASPEPLTLKTIAEVTELSKDSVEEIIKKLQVDFCNRGINIREVAEGYEMCTSPSMFDYIEKLNKVTSKQNLSKASLETLAIIAYNQPVTRADVEELRGVRTAKIISSLLNLKLIRIAGKSDKIGKPYVYGTTKEFLKYFGLKSIEDLPEINIAESLSKAQEERENE